MDKLANSQLPRIITAPAWTQFDPVNICVFGVIKTGGLCPNKSKDLPQLRDLIHYRKNTSTLSILPLQYYSKKIALYILINVSFWTCDFINNSSADVCYCCLFVFHYQNKTKL